MIFISVQFPHRQKQTGFFRDIQQCSFSVFFLFTDREKIIHIQSNSRNTDCSSSVMKFPTFCPLEIFAVYCDQNICFSGKPTFYKIIQTAGRERRSLIKMKSMCRIDYFYIPTICPTSFGCQSAQQSPYRGMTVNQMYLFFLQDFQNLF